jgi:hypothetical protein
VRTNTERLVAPLSPKDQYGFLFNSHFEAADEGTLNQMAHQGGCAPTPPGHPRVSDRDSFPPAARRPVTGVRLADDGRNGYRQ